MKVNDGLPYGWSVAYLGEFCSGRGRSVDPRRSPHERFELYSVPSHGTGSPEIVNGQDVGSAKQEVEPNTVLLCGINPRINRTWVVKQKTVYPQIASTEWLCFPPTAAFHSSYLRYYLMQYWFRDFLAQNASGVGGSLMRVKRTTLSRCPVSIAPLVEQRAIVAKIEQLFSELDKGVEQLQTVKRQLKQYRQAVLKAAFEGKLTEKWRAEQQAAGKLPSANELLEQIKKEREERYQQQLKEWKQKVAEWEAAGGKKSGRKRPSKPSSPRALLPLTEGELAGSPALPEGWAWERLGNVLNEMFDGPFGSYLKTKDYVESGVQVVRLENIGVRRFLNDKQSFVTEDKYQQMKKHTVSGGDIVFASFISDEVRACVLPKSLHRAINKADCFCLRPVSLISQEYLCSSFSSRAFYLSLAGQVHGATRPRVNLTQLSQAVVPICTLDEQHQIVQEIESRFSVLDELEKAVDQGLHQAETLRQSILKKAFEGRLLSEAELAAVRNDPEYEPADKLLERIKAEREQDKQSSRAKSARKGTRLRTLSRPQKDTNETASEAK